MDHKREVTKFDAIAALIGAGMLARAVEVLEQIAPEEKDRWPNIVVDGVVGFMTVGAEDFKGSDGKTMLQLLREALDSPENNWANLDHK